MSGGAEILALAAEYQRLRQALVPVNFPENQTTRQKIADAYAAEVLRNYADLMNALGSSSTTPTPPVEGDAT